MRVLGDIWAEGVVGLSPHPPTPHPIEMPCSFCRALCHSLETEQLHSVGSMMRQRNGHETYCARFSPCEIYDVDWSPWISWAARKITLLFFSVRHIVKDKVLSVK